MGDKIVVEFDRVRQPGESIFRYWIHTETGLVHLKYARYNNASKDLTYYEKAANRIREDRVQSNKRVSEEYKLKKGS